MGGMDGFGPVISEQNEPVFHAEWERRMYALANLLMRAAQVNIDEFRHAIERIPPARYLASSYYERWVAAAETVLVEHGVVTREELLAKQDAAVDPRLIANGVATQGPAPRQRQIGKKTSAGALCERRSGARTQPESSGTHALAALCARQSRRHRARLGSVRLPRHQRASRGHQAATLLFGLFRRARAVGKIRERSRATVHRFVGRLFRDDRAEAEAEG